MRTYIEQCKFYTNLPHTAFIHVDSLKWHIWHLIKIYSFEYSLIRYWLLFWIV